MTTDLLLKHTKWRDKVIGMMDPHADWIKSPVTVRHGRAFVGEPYPCVLHHPKDFSFLDLDDDKPSRKIQKATEGRRECDGGRFITVHPDGKDEEGRVVYICPNPDGTHTITGGAGGKLNGLRLTRVKSDEEYKRLSKQRAHEKQQALKAQEQAQADTLGAEEYARQNQEKVARTAEVDAQHKEAGRALVAAVAAQQGVDLASFAPSEEALKGLDPKTAAKLKAKTEDAALSWAKEIVERTKDIALTAYHDMSRSAIADMAASALANDTLDPKGKGYQAHMETLAQEHGLTTGKVEQAQHDVSIQKFLEQTDYNLDEARAKRAKVVRMINKRKESNADVRSGAAKLKEQGQGPDAIADLPISPEVKNVEEAVALLKAGEAYKRATMAAQEGKKQLKEIDDLRELPKSAVAETSEPTDAELLKAVESSLTEGSQREAMVRLVEGGNALEQAYGSLHIARSVGHAAALSSIMQTVDGTNVDPLVMDTLGPAAFASVVVNGWRQSMSPREFNAVKSALAEHHIATQESIANKGMEQAERLLAAAEAIADIEPVDADTMELALTAHAEKIDLINRAKEAAGVARGRLEASAAINYALEQKAPKTVQVSLGKTSTGDALQQCYAIGLTKPTTYDNNGNVADPGQFTIVSDGVNRILQLHPEGQQALAPTPDAEFQERSQRSAAIKVGEQDVPGWIPHGLSDRPATTFELDPTAIRSLDHRLDVTSADSNESIAEKLKSHIGQRINAGQDALDVQTDIHSESFAQQLGLSGADYNRFKQVVNDVAPFMAPSAKDLSASGRAAFREAFDSHRQKLRAKLEGYANAALDGNSEEVALNRQRLPLDKVTQDCAYVAALADPRTSFAFTPPSDLTRQGRDGIRSYAMQHLFNLSPKSGDVITPLSDTERKGYDLWQGLAAKGDPYGQIQAKMRDGAEPDMFGDVQHDPLASVNLGSPDDVLRVGKEQAGNLGYTSVIDADGKKSFPMLEPNATRTRESIAGELRGKIKAKLRQEFFRNQAGMTTLAASDWNPESVKTASDRWGDYVRDMGGEGRAIASVQELMQGDFVKRFVAQYQQRTGNPLQLAKKSLTFAQTHREALLGHDEREAITSQKRSQYAQVGKNQTGKFATGERIKKVETQAHATQQDAKLFGESEGKRQVDATRLSIGTAAEGALKSMMPYIDTNKPLEAGSDLNFSGDAIHRQRSIRLIEENKRQAICLAVGGGKTSVAIGAFTDLHHEGKVKKALFVVPSNQIGQTSSECYKFIDPSSGIRWHANPSASPEERRSAYSNPDCHMCVVTPEALRGDVTKAVAEDLGKSEADTVEHLAGLPEDEQDKLIHAALDKRDWKFDYTVHDEFHRLLDRNNKQDSHMATIADSAARKSEYYVPMSADPVKNDVSELSSLLNKVDPKRYPESKNAAFLRRYGRNTLASSAALQKELAPYIYAASLNLGVTHERQLHTGEDMKLTPQQQDRHDAILKAYDTGRAARGFKDTAKLKEALKVIAPHHFKDGEPDADHVAKMGRSLGALRDTALNRAVNLDPNGVKMQWINKHIDANRTTPTVVFAHNLDAVKMIKEQLAAKGHKVVSLMGGSSSQSKDNAMQSFAPTGGQEAKADVFVSSDAGSTGANLQRGSTLINYDTPQTATTHEQRIGREVRGGQKNHVMVHDLVADAPIEHAARKRLEDKGELHDIATTAAEAIDDSGLAMRIANHRAKAFENHWSKPQSDAAEREEAA